MKYQDEDLEQLITLKTRSQLQFDKVIEVFTHLALDHPDFELPKHYLIDKPELAFVIRFDLVAFHVKFNVVSDEEPEDTKTDKVTYSVQTFSRQLTGPISTLIEFEDVGPAVSNLVMALRS